MDDIDLRNLFVDYDDYKQFLDLDKFKRVQIKTNFPPLRPNLRHGRVTDGYASLPVYKVGNDVVMAKRNMPVPIYSSEAEAHDALIELSWNKNGEHNLMYLYLRADKKSAGGLPFKYSFGYIYLHGSHAKEILEKFKSLDSIMDLALLAKSDDLERQNPRVVCKMSNGAYCRLSDRAIKYGYRINFDTWHRTGIENVQFYQLYNKSRPEYPYSVPSTQDSVRNIKKLLEVEHISVKVLRFADYFAVHEFLKPLDKLFKSKLGHIEKLLDNKF